MHMQRSSHHGSFSQRSALFLVALAGLLLVVAPAAQAQEAGYITEDQVLARMPEVQQAQRQIQTQLQTQFESQYGQQQQQLQERQQSFQEKVRSFQNRSEMMSEASRQERRTELGQQQAQLQQDAQAMQREMAQQERALQRQLLRPVIQKYQDAVAAVAEARGLPFVLNDQALVYRDESEMVNVTEAVASRLGVDLDSAPIGATTSGR
jgi:Skp family chaperone for outer membrane proteins